MGQSGVSLDFLENITLSFLSRDNIFKYTIQGICLTVLKTCCCGIGKRIENTMSYVLMMMGN
jgi:hypothetical protein